MLVKIAITAVFLLSGELLLYVCFQRGCFNARKEGDRFVLEYRDSQKLAALGMLMFGLVLLALVPLLPISNPHFDVEIRFLAWLLAGLWNFVALVSVCETLFVKIEFDAAFIQARSPWRRSRKIPWSKLTGCRFSAIQRAYILEAGDHGRVTLPLWLPGLGTFLDELHSRGIKADKWRWRD